MAKSQRRSNREVRKPKKAISQVGNKTADDPTKSQVEKLMSKPKGKL